MNDDVNCDCGGPHEIVQLPNMKIVTGSKVVTGKMKNAVTGETSSQMVIEVQYTEGLGCPMETMNLVINPEGGCLLGGELVTEYMGIPMKERVENLTWQLNQFNSRN